MQIHPDAIPLRKDEAGAVRVGATRVLFVLVVEAFRQGHNPEQIVEMFTTLDLADVYAVVGYYLRHKDEVDRYVREWHESAQELRRTIETAQGPPRVNRATLLARRAEMEKQRAAAGQ